MRSNRYVNHYPTIAYNALGRGSSAKFAQLPALYRKIVDDSPDGFFNTHSGLLVLAKGQQVRAVLGGCSGYEQGKSWCMMHSQSRTKDYDWQVVACVENKDMLEAFREGSEVQQRLNIALAQYVGSSLTSQRMSLTTFD